MAPAGKQNPLRGKILTEKEIKTVADRMREALGPAIMELARGYGVNVEDMLRFQSFSARLVEARESQGLTLKEAAAALKIPQYRLKEIEACNTKRLRPEVVLKYIEFLGLAGWFGKWRKANAEYAKRMGLVPGRKKERP